MPARTSVPGWRSPFHPAHAVASVPVVARHYPASATAVLYPCGTTRSSAASDLTTADFAGSILLEDQSRRTAAYKTVGCIVFSNVRPACEVPVRVLSQSPHFLK